MSLIGRILSPRLWAARTVCSVVLIALIWSDTMDATEMILSLPAEFFPLALMLGALCGLFITGIKSFGSSGEQDKKLARTTGEKLAYGLNYLSVNIAVIIASAILAPVLTGCYYQAAGVDPNLWGVIGIALTVGVIVAIGGDKLLNTLLEGFRDRAKAKAARSETKTE